MPNYSALLDRLKHSPKTWLVTGAAGFIGSNLVQTLLGARQKVTGLDNLSIGYRKNLDLVREAVDDAAWKNFSFVRGDIRDLATCHTACAVSSCAISTFSGNARTLTALMRLLFPSGFPTSCAAIRSISTATAKPHAISAISPTACGPTCWP